MLPLVKKFGEKWFLYYTGRSSSGCPYTNKTGALPGGPEECVFFFVRETRALGRNFGYLMFLQFFPSVFQRKKKKQRNKKQETRNKKKQETRNKKTRKTPESGARGLCGIRAAARGVCLTARVVRSRPAVVLGHRARHQRRRPAEPKKWSSLASRSVRALRSLTPQVLNPGSLYRCGNEKWRAARGKKGGLQIRPQKQTAFPRSRASTEYH